MKATFKIFGTAAVAGIVVGTAAGLPGLWLYWCPEAGPIVAVAPSPPLVHRSIAELRKPVLAACEVWCGTMSEQEEAKHRRNWKVIETTMPDDVINTMIELTRNGEASSWAIGIMGSWIERQKMTPQEFLQAIRHRYTKVGYGPEDRVGELVFRFVADHGNAPDIVWMERKTQQIEPERQHGFEIAIEVLKERLGIAGSLPTGRGAP
jgi:hypothetical protein